MNYITWNYYNLSFFLCTSIDRLEDRYIDHDNYLIIKVHYIHRCDVINCYFKIACYKSYCNISYWFCHREVLMIVHQLISYLTKGYFTLKKNHYNYNTRYDINEKLWWLHRSTHMLIHLQLKESMLLLLYWCYILCFHVIV